MIGHGHREYQIDLLAVGGIEIDRWLQPQQRAARCFKGRRAAMRYGDAMADGGAAEPFARLQAVAQVVRAGLAAGQHPGGRVQHRIAVHGIQYGRLHVRQSIGEGHVRKSVAGRMRQAPKPACGRSACGWPPRYQSARY
jgi:hypothetical protein